MVTANVLVDARFVSPRRGAFRPLHQQGDYLVPYAGSGLRGIGEGVEEIDDLLRLVTDEFLQEGSRVSLNNLSEYVYGRQAANTELGTTALECKKWASSFCSAA